MTVSDAPELYGLEADGLPVLKGVLCAACRRIDFPFQTFGCVSCGRFDSIEALDIAPTGTVAAVTTAHLHFTPEPVAPFVVGCVKLDAGPMVRAMFDDSEAVVGDRVVGSIDTGRKSDTAVSKLTFGRGEPENG